MVEPPADNAPRDVWKRHLDALKRLAHERPDSLELREQIQAAQQKLAER